MRGATPWRGAATVGGRVFLSTLPARGATGVFDFDGLGGGGFLSTLPARGATEQRLHAAGQLLISIHAPREGSDPDHPSCTGRFPRISILAPREGSDSTCLRGWKSRHIFLSTLPARGATIGLQVLFDRKANFYPRSPRGERRGGARRSLAAHNHFYPRSPRGERPAAAITAAAAEIHFYPRSPRGERLAGGKGGHLPHLFLSTLPARGATFARGACGTSGRFLSTLPARGATRWPGSTLSSIQFLSTLPARGATETKGGYVAIHLIFLSTLPARGATPGWTPRKPPMTISIHAPREGSDSQTVIPRPP